MMGEISTIKVTGRSEVRSNPKVRKVKVDSKLAT